MSDRREFFKTVLGGALAALPVRSASLSAEDAGALKVEPGISLPVRIQGARIEYLRLVMPDGVRLAATLYLPEKLEGRVPTILEAPPQAPPGLRQYPPPARERLVSTPSTAGSSTRTFYPSPDARDRQLSDCMRRGLELM